MAFPKNMFLFYFTIFISGMSVLAIELSASRLLAPYFGTTLFVWTNIIGVVLIALSLGYYYGGKLVDAHPLPRLFYTIIFFAGVYICLIPFIAFPIMRLSLTAIDIHSFSLFYNTFIFPTV